MMRPYGRYMIYDILLYIYIYNVLYGIHKPSVATVRIPWIWVSGDSLRPIFRPGVQEIGAKTWKVVSGGFMVTLLVILC